MLTKAFGESIISRRQVQLNLFQNWFQKYRKYVNDDALPGHHSTWTTDKSIEAVKKIISYREIADEVGISLSPCQAVFFTDVVGVKCVEVKIVPKLLNFKQKQRRMAIT